MFDVLPPDWFCPPCQDFPPRHDECEPVPWCCCLVEALLEAEEKP